MKPKQNEAGREERKAIRLKAVRLLGKGERKGEESCKLLGKGKGSQTTLIV